MQAEPDTTIEGRKVTDATADEALVGANAKCIVGSIALALAYWILPKRNKWVLLFILYSTYLAIAWYDWAYACKRDMRPTYLAFFYDFLKPQDSRQVREWKQWPSRLRRKILVVDVAILCILIILFPFFLAWDPK